MTLLGQTIFLMFNVLVWLWCENVQCNVLRCSCVCLLVYSTWLSEEVHSVGKNAYAIVRVSSYS